MVNIFNRLLKFLPKAVSLSSKHREVCFFGTTFNSTFRGQDVGLKGYFHHSYVYFHLQKVSASGFRVHFVQPKKPLFDEVKLYYPSSYYNITYLSCWSLHPLFRNLSWNSIYFEVKNRKDSF